MKKLFFLLLVLVLVFMASLSFADTQSWTKMKNFSIKTLSGEQFDLYKTLEEKELVLIDLWSIECGPCIEMAYSLDQVYDEYKGRVGFISINPINKQQDVQDFIAFRGLRIPCAVNANCRSWSDDGYPTLILINRNYDVLYSHGMSLDQYNLRRLLDWGLNMTEEELQQYYSMEIPYLFTPHGSDISRKESNHIRNEIRCLSSVYNLKNNMSLTVKCPGLRRIIVDENLKYLESSQLVGEFFLAPSDASHLTVTVHTDKEFNPGKANMFSWGFTKTPFREAKKNGNDYIFEIELPDDVPAEYSFYASDDYGVINKDSYVGFYCFRSMEDAEWQFKDWEKQYDCEFPWHVEKIKSVSGIILSDMDLVILQGKEANLTAEIIPKSASDPSIEWVSSDDAVATVQNGTIKAVSPGECDIICKSQDGSGKQAACHIQVATAVKGIKINENPVTLLIGASKDLASYGLTYTVTPEDTYWKKVTWESSNEAIAVVDENGVVTGVGPGKATITAWSTQPDSKVKAQAQVVVQQAVTGIELPENELTISLGKSATIKPVILPADAANKKLEWSSSDELVATVNNGNVKAVSCGECDIICKSADGSEISGKCHVTIIQMVQSIQSKNNNMTVYCGNTYDTEITIKPEDATNKELSFSSSDETVCTVNEKGVITAVGAGNCKITCSSTDGSGKSVTISIKAIDNRISKDTVKKLLMFATCNDVAEDIFTADGMDFDKKKLHNYSDFNSLLRIIDEGNWITNDGGNTWQIKDFLVQHIIYGGFRLYSFDISFNGKEYVLNNGWVVHAGKKEWLNKSDPSKYGEDDLSNLEFYVYFTVSPKQIGE